MKKLAYIGFNPAWVEPKIKSTAQINAIGIKFHVRKNGIHGIRKTGMRVGKDGDVRRRVKSRVVHRADNPHRRVGAVDG